MNGHHGTSHHGVPGAVPGEKVLDVVCGMWIDPQTAPAHYEYQGRVYFFCAPGCLHLFRENPEAYLNPRVEQPDAQTPERRGETSHDHAAFQDGEAPEEAHHNHKRGHGHRHMHRHGHGHHHDHDSGGPCGCGGCGHA